MFKYRDRDKNQRFVELDALRGIAVILVLLSHYTWAYDYHFKILNEHIFHFPYGGFGVQIFFMISGFVIFMTIEKVDSVKHFAINRFTRLYPTYWISIMITLTVITIFPVPTLGHYNWVDVLKNFTMFQGFLKAPHVDQVYWSLQVELLFYIIIAIIYYTKQLNRIEFYSLLWLFMVIVTLLFDFLFEKYLRVLAILDHAPLFIAGMMFYKVKLKKSYYLNHIIIGLSLVIFLFSLYFQLIDRGEIGISIVPFLLIICAFLIFYLLIYFDVPFLRNKYLLFLGFISYPLYLLHNVIGYSLIYRLKMIYDNQFFYVVVTTLLTIFFAYIMTKFMEQPSKWLKKTLTKKYVRS